MEIDYRFFVKFDFGSIFNSCISTKYFISLFPYRLLCKMGCCNRYPYNMAFYYYNKFCNLFHSV